MSFGPNFVATLDDEVRAFLHVAGIELRPNVHGDAMPVMRCKDGFDWILWLPNPASFGGMRSMAYWKEVARIAYDEIVPGN